jgi:hypothetical protein
VAQQYARIHRQEHILGIALTLSEGFWFGVLGGLLGELFNLFKLRQQPTKLLPAWVTSFWYWILTLFMIVSGGVLVVIYLKSNIPVVPILAVNIGASAPLIVGTLVAQVPAISPGKVN